jgi:nitroreductase
MNEMDVLDVLEDRRSVRNYKDLPLDESVIRPLIDAAIAAPSAMNQKPWAFAVCLNAKRIEDLGKRAKDWLLQNRERAPEQLHRRLCDPGFFIFHHAPACILVLATSSRSEAIEDCCLAAENLLLAARDQGLASCWIGGLSRPWLDLASTKLELGLRVDYRVVAPIILGYPAEWPPSSGRNAPEIFWID